MMLSSGPYCHITIAAYIVNCICYRFWCSPLASTWDSSSWSWWGWTPWRTRPWTTGPSLPSCRSCTWGWQTPPRWLWGSAVSPGSTDAGTAGRREAGTDWLQAGTLQHYHVTLVTQATVGSIFQIDTRDQNKGPPESVNSTTEREREEVRGWGWSFPW